MPTARYVDNCGPGEQCSYCYYGCSGTCSGGCSGGCKGCRGCSGCGGCDNTCEGGCTGSCSGACKGNCKGTCGVSCSGACNAGCSGNVADQAFQALKNGLNEYITEQDLNNIYLIFNAVWDRRIDAGVATSELAELSFTKEKTLITKDDITELSNNATKVNLSINNYQIIKDNFIKTNDIQQLLDKANIGYKTEYSRGSIT